jgi:dihydrofolate reductase
MIDGFDSVGAWILGRNMFGPIRGAWDDKDWKGWWGANPPYHVPTFVLTNYPREPIQMEGGTVFHFVTGGIEDAWERGRDAAGEKDVRVGGGVSIIRQYLEAGLIDLMHVVIVPLLLGRGEHLLGGLDLPALGYSATRSEPGDGVMHVWIENNQDRNGRKK